MRYLADAMREAREDADMSRRELADRVGVHPNTVRLWELGLCVPSVLAAAAAAGALGITIDEYIGVRRPERRD